MLSYLWIDIGSHDNNRYDRATSLTVFCPSGMGMAVVECWLMRGVKLRIPL